MEAVWPSVEAAAVFESSAMMRRAVEFGLSKAKRPAHFLIRFFNNGRRGTPTSSN